MGYVKNKMNRSESVGEFSGNFHTTSKNIFPTLKISSLVRDTKLLLNRMISVHKRKKEKKMWQAANRANVTAAPTMLGRQNHDNCT